MIKTALTILSAAALVASPCTQLAQTQTPAQAYPNKPIKVIVNFPAGGAADALARAIAPGLGESLGQPVVIENRGGANGNIGGEAVAKAAPDGYTLLMSSGGMVSVNPHLYAKMPFDPAKDLVPVGAAAKVLVFLVVKPAIPANSIAELIAHMKANPGKLSYGSPGTGSSPHLSGEMFTSMAGLTATHVPYKGAAPALQDLLGGQIDFLFDPGPGLMQVRAGKLRLLAVGSPKRTPLFPDVPTLDEAGLKGFDTDTVFGFYAPVGTPLDVVARLNREINKQLETAAVRDRVMAIGGEVAAMSPADFSKRAEDDSKRFGAIIRARGIRAE